jgi:CheY-like chemotaxis protein
VLAKRLGELGYRLFACESADSAIAEMHRAPVDLVLAELRMAPMSGVELTRLIRDDTVLKDTPVILITGKSASALSSRTIRVNSIPLIGAMRNSASISSGRARCSSEIASVALVQAITR